MRIREWTIIFLDEGLVLTNRKFKTNIIKLIEQHGLETWISKQ